MPLDPQLWQDLENHGVAEAHLRLLRTLLQVQRNGWFGLHYVNGQVTQCDARLVMPAREYEVARITDVLGGDGVGRS